MDCCEDGIKKVACLNELFRLTGIPLIRLRDIHQWLLNKLLGPRNNDCFVINFR